MTTIFCLSKDFYSILNHADDYNIVILKVIDIYENIMTYYLVDKPKLYNMKNMKISRVVNNSKACYIRLLYQYRFNFGWDSLYMEVQNLYIYNRFSDYENNLQSKSNTFTIEEIEAFIVTIDQ
ncbi:kinase-like domain-containing protein [Rhizophagus irregularis DAOM 181602=DAOM 197198]|nr:kinase-like domain-containing protein [Rhizophagus irregularis DAOM 181602=DAOM 197198]